MSHVCEPIPDVQSTEDLRRIPINKVGINDIRHPVRVQDRSGGEQHTIANFNMYVNLPHRGLSAGRRDRLLPAGRGRGHRHAARLFRWRGARHHRPPRGPRGCALLHRGGQLRPVEGGKDPHAHGDGQGANQVLDVPTTAEAGYPCVLSASTRGIAAPKGLPDPVMKKLQDGFRKAMMSKGHLDKLESAGQPVKILVGEEAVKYYWDNYQVAKKWVEHVRKK